MPWTAALHHTTYREFLSRQLPQTSPLEIMIGRTPLLAQRIVSNSHSYTICQSICRVIFCFVIGIIGIMLLLYTIKSLQNYILPPLLPPRLSELSQEDLGDLHMQAQRNPNFWKKYLEDMDAHSRSDLLMGWYHARLPPPPIKNLIVDWNTLLREGIPNLNATIFMETEKIFAFSSLHPNQLAWHVHMLKYAPIPEGSEINYPLCAIFELNIALEAESLATEWGPNFSQLLIDYALKCDRYSDFLYRELTSNVERYKETLKNKRFDFNKLFERVDSKDLEDNISFWLETLWEEAPDTGA